MGVAVRRYIDFLIILFIPTPLSFFVAASLFFVHVFFILVYVIFCNIANIAQRTFEVIQDLRSCGHDDIIIIISTRTCVDHESQDFHVRGTE